MWVAGRIMEYEMDIVVIFLILIVGSFLIILWGLNSCPVCGDKPHFKTFLGKHDCNCPCHKKKEGGLN